MTEILEMQDEKTFVVNTKKHGLFRIDARTRLHAIVRVACSFALEKFADEFTPDEVLAWSVTREDGSTPNNEQIDQTDYYRLPCGRYLEDFISWRRLDFAWGSAVKYLWRAGKKDGELAAKDIAKARHYIRFIAARSSDLEDAIALYVDSLVSQAYAWDGKEVAA